MLKWPKKPLLAVLAALTAVGLGVPCAMADGTAAATAYITVAAVGGTTLDGRTYKAYRLGSYGKTDVRVDPDSGDRYAASIPVSTDPDKAEVVTDAGSKAGFTGDDMLAAAWASTDSAKLEAFARELASSLSNTEPAASVEGAGRMGPFTPGVYLVSGSDGSACLTGTLPSEGVGDRSHVLGIAAVDDIFACVENGGDTFDCVAPARCGRNGAIFTRHGRYNIKRAQFKHDFGPLEEGCDCYTCTHYSRAYVDHALRAREFNGFTLATIHNEHFFVKLLDDIRASIDGGYFNEFRDETLAKFYENGSKG